ncbi:MAG: hypothetical protein HFF17_08300 [Oscillospiraceae bacterium]|nr:hypothetical protein [Oscillospiraceae bacterium]
MIRIRDLSLAPGQGEAALRALAARVLRVRETDITALEVRKKSIDARRKDDVRVIYTVDARLRQAEAPALHRLRGEKKVSAAEFYEYRVPQPVRQPAHRPVVAGFGPGGMFAALVLAEAGLRPIVLERGLDAAARKRKVEAFWRTGVLDPACNVQFGEGGAGTFSDGKLNTGIKNERIGWVLEQLVLAGARPDIRTDAKPHIGTDVLVTVVQNLRRRIEALGGEVRFGCRLTSLTCENGRLEAVEYEQMGQICPLPCRQLILAIGHSARDTFVMLHRLGVPMARKPFSMGVRIEHRQDWLDRAQYGSFAGHPCLPPADYKLAVHLLDGGSSYTFCMCPGGYVVAAASEHGGVVTNGMSNADRDGGNCNAALLATLHPENFPGDGVLAGMAWQRALEQAAFALGGGNYRAPAQLVGDFLAGRPSLGPGSVAPTYRPGVTYTDLRQCLPPCIADTLAQALPVLDRRIPGFAVPDAVLTAPETRSSCPVRILRDEGMQSALRGLFPCGEGAGYAGGITSAAVDGMRCAEALINSMEI